MSSTFSLSRLGKLINKQFFENSRLYGFSVLAMTGLLGVIFVCWILFLRPHYDEREIYSIFIVGLFIGGTIFSSMSFHMLGNKDKGVYWLAIPATHLEKLICTIIYTTILFTVVYCLCFFLVKSISMAFLTDYIRKNPGTSYAEIKDFDKGFGTVIRYLLCGYFAVQSLYLLGSAYFRRYSFVLTTVVGAAVIFSFAYYLMRIHQGMLGPVSWDIVSIRKSDVSVKDGYLHYSLSPMAIAITRYAAQFAWAPLFWIVTWFRLKEKEL